MAGRNGKGYRWAQMCGIAGIVNLRPGPAPQRVCLERMLGSLQHRGPDEFGLYRDESVGLAHARLSIIDLRTGQQPLSNEDGSVWISFNGEIFNYIELREELLACGHQFRTESDTEVIVHAWEQWGQDALARFNGQWAFALWDRRRQRLVLSRDRLGIRPLYYAEQDNRLVFGSEIKAIFAGAPKLERAFSPIGMEETFTFWTVVPPRSVFRGIQELEPGTVRIYEGDRVRQTSYWAPSYRVGFSGSAQEAQEAVSEALGKATSLRMLRSDVPVGSYLSGGIDSSLIATLGLRAKGESFHTFSLRFQDAEYDETQYQHQMVERLGSEHHEVIVSRNDIAKVFPAVVNHAERPVLRTAPAPLFLLSKLVHDCGIKVVLTGEGADEMFAGYDVFREGLVRRFWAREPESELRPRLLERLYPYLARSPIAQKAMARKFFGRNLSQWREPGFAHDTRWHTTSAVKRLLLPEMRTASDVVADLLGSLPSDFSSWTPLAGDQYLEVRTLLSGYLLSSQGDRMLMGNSVEGRFPFLDCDVVELANSLPDKFKLKALDEKHVLKRMARGLIPDEILKRKKQPYRAPDALAFVGADRPDWIDEVLSESVLRSAGVFNVRAAGKLWEKCRARADKGQYSNTDNMALVAVISTQLLWESFIRRSPNTAVPARIHTVVDHT